MNPESSPFRPGQPIPIEFFVGRKDEIKRLTSMVRASLHGRFKIGFITGERGIGKSSLVSFVRHLDEVKEFYLHSFESASVKISDEDIHTLIRFTGGLPVLAHEIGDAIWRVAQNQEIKSDEILKGIFLAAEVIGRKLLEPQVFSAIRSERYRSILRKMADKPLEKHFQRSELVERLTHEEKKVMDNFLQRMKQLGALNINPEVRGGYQFQNHLHALYFWLESQRAKNIQKQKTDS